MDDISTYGWFGVNGLTSISTYGWFNGLAGKGIFVGMDGIFDEGVYF
jgi:hypothetical protein